MRARMAMEQWVTYCCTTTIIRYNHYPSYGADGGHSCWLGLGLDILWRMELQMQLQDSVFWTGSTSLLKYINNDPSRFRTFVTNRVSDILTVYQGHLNGGIWTLQIILWIKSGPRFLIRQSGLPALKVQENLAWRLRCQDECYCKSNSDWSWGLWTSNKNDQPILILDSLDKDDMLAL